MLELAGTVNYVLMSKGVQSQTYRLRDDELKSLELVVPFLEPFAAATKSVHLFFRVTF